MENTSYMPLNTPAWNKLIELASEVQASATPITIKQLFADDAERAEKYSLTSGELKLDFSKNLMDDQIWSGCNFFEIVICK